MLGKLLSKTGQTLWLILSCIAMLWIGYEGMVRHQGPLGWLEARGYLNPLTLLFVFAGSAVALWPLGFLCDFITRRGMFDKRTKTEFDTEESASAIECVNHTPIPFESREPVEISGCRLPPWTSFLQSLRRVVFATLVAVPSTGALAAAMLLVPPDVAFGIGVSGMVLFSLGKGLDRPILLAIGGVVMFAGVLSWGVRQGQ